GVLEGASLATLEGRARAAEAALAVIREHPSELVRDQYVMQVADRCRIDPDRLREGLRRGPRPSAVQPPASRPVAEPPVAGPEVEALKLAVHRPEEMAGRLHEVLFADDSHLAAYRALATSTTLHEAIESA